MFCPMASHALYRLRVRSAHETCLVYFTQPLYSTGSLDCAYITLMASGEVAFMNTVTKYLMISSSRYNSCGQQIYQCARIACAPSPTSIPLSTLSFSATKPSPPSCIFFALAVAACSSLILLSISGYHLSPTS